MMGMPPPKLSLQAFANANDFINTLRSGYKEISHDRDGINLPDLQFAAEHASSPKLQAAASIAAAHYKDLEDLQMNQDFKGVTVNPFGPDDDWLNKISMSDLDYAHDMLDHNSFGYAAEYAAISGVTGALVAPFAAGITAIGVGYCGIFTPVGLAVTAAGLAGVASVGLTEYKAVTAFSRRHQTEDKDTAMFNSWLNIPSDKG
jgi:hypothetical protein